MTGSPRRICILVLGMHRSGTSALAGMLHRLGAGLPEALLPPNAWNTAGHWEPARLVALNDRMLREAGSSWDDFRPFEPATLGPPRLAAYRDEISSILAAEFDSHLLFVLKDPRVCRLVPLYRSILDESGIDTRYVLVRRRSGAVAASLVARDGMTSTYGHLLWLRHVLDAEAATRGGRRVLVSYEGLLANARGVAYAIGRDLEVDWPTPFDRAATDIARFISPALQHHADAVGQLEAGTPLQDVVALTGDAFGRLESSPDDPAAIATLDAVRTRLDRTETLFTGVLFEEVRQRARLVRDHRHKAELAADLQANLDASKLALERATATIEMLTIDLRRKGDDLLALAAERDRERAGWQERVAAADTRALRHEEATHAARVEIGRLEDEMAELRILHAEAKDRADLLRRELTTAEGTIAATRQSTSWRVTAPLRLASTTLRNAALTIAKTGFGPAVGRVARYVYHAAPMPAEAKMLWKERLFLVAAPLFRHTRAYRDWRVQLDARTRPPPASTWRPSPVVAPAAVPAISDARMTPIEGGAAPIDGAPTIVAVAHAANARLFGAERSFVDLVASLHGIGHNVVAVLPAANEAHLQLLRPFIRAAYAFPYAWWTAGVPLDEEAVARFRQAFIDSNARAVHVNTIVLREPLIAAGALAVPSVVHARELIDRDAALQATIGEDAAAIVRQVKASASFICANSAATAELFATDGRTFTIPNMVDAAALDLSPRRPDRTTIFGLIGSNHPKKGLADLLELAERCSVEAPHARFRVVGPRTVDVVRAGHDIAAGRLPPNIDFLDYQDSPAAALAGIDVVLNLSHFAESFGRTVAEGMAARRPAIAYAHGALPELIRHGVTGYLVSDRTPAAAVGYVKRLAGDRKLLRRMGHAARETVVARFSPEIFRESLGTLYGAVLAKSPRSTVASRATRPAVDVSIIVPSYNYARYLQDRLQSILAQTVRPREIIFLDDASNDASVEIARRTLAAGDIPFIVHQNATTQGVYAQWLAGIGRASGSFVWIAEADDLCDPTMLEELCRLLEDDSTVLAYCQSRRLDETGAVTAATNLGHTRDLDPVRWNSDYLEVGTREVVDFLVYRNTIPNVSATLFRRAAAAGIEGELGRMRHCGDLLLYAHLLRAGRVAYSARPLNGFRRHAQSTTARTSRSVGYLEELVGIRRTMADWFPIHPRQVPAIADRIDRDYRIDGVARNSIHPVAAGTLSAIAALAAGRLRVALVTTNDNSFTGGSEVLWREAALRLRAEGHDVIVAMGTFDPRPPFVSALEQAGIKVVFRGGEFDVLARFNPDLVVISTGDQDEGLAYYEACKDRALPYVVVNHLTKEPQYWPIRKHRTAAIASGYKAARRIFFTSWNNHRVMEQRLGASITNAELFYNPLDVPRDVDLPFPPMDDGIHLAMPSRLLKIHKGQHLVLEVLARSAWRDRRIVLNLYGDGPDREALAAEARERGLDNVRFAARVADMRDIWRANHGILLSSFMEGLPIVLVGAMLARRVPIVTDVGGHAELIEDNLSGFIARRPDADAFAEAMERAFRRLDNWPAIGEAARRAALAVVPEDPVGHFVERLVDTAHASRRRLAAAE